MPQKLMFDSDNGSGQLLEIMNKLNAAMAGIKNVKTVEDLQGIINNLNRVMLDLKKLVGN